MNKVALTNKIREKGLSLGFDLVGFSKADQLQKEARNLEMWLSKGHHGTMSYMENNFEKRTDPRKLVEGAKSVISVLHNYMPLPEDRQPTEAPKISTYAWGPDYHYVLKAKLQQLLDEIRGSVGEVNARMFTDSAPVMDKVWAAKSGLGWVGKNTNLIHPKKGSWFFIGELILDVAFEYDGPMEDYCGTCTACIDACPTEALAPYQIDANKCISYLTIELKEDMPSKFNSELDGWAYGCDICQDVCPWNRFSVPESTGAFKPLEHLLSFEMSDWAGLTKTQYRKLTKQSAMSRVKWEKWQSNLDATDAKSFE